MNAEGANELARSHDMRNEIRTEEQAVSDPSTYNRQYIILRPFKHTPR